MAVYVFNQVDHAVYSSVAVNHLAYLDVWAGCSCHISVFPDVLDPPDCRDLTLDIIFFPEQQHNSTLSAVQHRDNRFTCIVNLKLSSPALMPDYLTTKASARTAGLVISVIAVLTLIVFGVIKCIRWGPALYCKIRTSSKFRLTIFHKRNRSDPPGEV